MKNLFIGNLSFQTTESELTPEIPTPILARSRCLLPIKYLLVT